MTFLPPCTECKRPLVPRHSPEVPEGHIRHRALGMCSACYARKHPGLTPRRSRSTRTAFHAVSMAYRLGNGQTIRLPSERVTLRMTCSPDDGIIDPIAVWRGWKDWTAPRLTAREVLCVVAELTTRYWNYPEIGDRLGITDDFVRGMVLRFDLPRTSRRYGDDYLCQLIVEPARRRGATPEALRLAGVETA